MMPTYDHTMRWWSRVVVLICLICATGWADENQPRPISKTIAVDGFAGAGLMSSSLSLAPPNDNFADAEALIGAAGSRRGTNIGASLENGEPEHYLFARIPARSSVWFKWTAPSHGWATFETCGIRSRFDSALVVYTGSELSRLRLVTDDRDTDDNCEPASRVHFQTAARTGYWIAVAGHTGHGESEGDFTLVWNRDAPKKPTGGSCFFYKGVRRWCLGPGNSAWDPCQAAEVAKIGERYWVWEGNTSFGYVRRAGRGRWRAMVAVPKGWARDGTIIRASNGRWIISSGGRRLGYASGRYPYSVAVGAYRLLAGNC